MTTKRPTLSFDRAHELLRYEPETGKLFWRVATSNRVKAGAEAGALGGPGYRYLMVETERFLAHRLIFFMQTGRWPIGDVDHMDGNRVNNAWANLRECDRKTNMENRKAPSSKSRTGVLGVSLSRGRFKAQIASGGKNRCLGRFDTVQEAQEAYLKAKALVHAGYVA
jgi:hypothetical protein